VRAALLLALVPDQRALLEFGGIDYLKLRRRLVDLLLH